jgi:hypothetical protein
MKVKAFCEYCGKEKLKRLRVCDWCFKLSCCCGYEEYECKEGMGDSYKVEYGQGLESLEAHLNRYGPSHKIIYVKVTGWEDWLVVWEPRESD